MKLKLAMATIAATAFLALGLGGTAKTAEAAPGHYELQSIWVPGHYETQPAGPTLIQVWVPGHYESQQVWVPDPVVPVVVAPCPVAPPVVRPVVRPIYRPIVRPFRRPLVRPVFGRPWRPGHVRHHGRGHVHVGVGGIRVGVGW